MGAEVSTGRKPSILDGGLIVRDMCCHVIGPAQSSHMCEMIVIAMWLSV
jgi:hypothetical protein